MVSNDNVVSLVTVHVMPMIWTQINLLSTWSLMCITFRLTMAIIKTPRWLWCSLSHSQELSDHRNIENNYFKLAGSDQGCPLRAQGTKVKSGLSGLKNDPLAIGFSNAINEIAFGLLGACKRWTSKFPLGHFGAKLTIKYSKKTKKMLYCRIVIVSFEQLR